MLAQFLRSPQLEAFCQQYGASTLAEIHSSFCNKDRIATIIQKQRLLSYPNGQDINGLLFLQNRDSLINVSGSNHPLPHWMTIRMLMKCLGIHSREISWFSRYNGILCLQGSDWLIINFIFIWNWYVFQANSIQRDEWGSFCNIHARSMQKLVSA